MTLPPATPTPLAEAVVLDAVQRIESTGLLDDVAELRQAFHTRPTRAAQVRQRAWLLGQRLGLPAELAALRQAGWLAVAVLAMLTALAALGLARAVLGQGRGINAVAAFALLLGPHLLSLAAWLAGLLLPGTARSGALLGRGALWLTARLPLGRGAHAPLLLASAAAVLRRQGLLGWLTGAISHAVWALAFVLMLAVLAFGFAFHAYALTWESTILSAGFFQRFVHVTGALPALLGFAVPDAAAVHAAGTHMTGPGAAPSQSAWAWWLLGCVAVYGLLPRALLAALCHWRWRAGAQRLAQVDMADPDVRRIVARLDALAPPPEVIDPEQRSAAVAGPLPAAPLGTPGAPGSLAVIGFELPPETPWPLPGVPAGTAAPQRLAGSAAERQAALSALAAQRPQSLLIVVHAAASPDRGTARFVREATALASRAALLLHGAEHAASGAQRWRQWAQAEGLEALALLDSAPAATQWTQP
ncbi:MAG: DUF2868 domain-containing protein [Pseudomonadota bacterium]|nr:DUF2868 domain-containing protein [Pseudomonadota bacterium]